jgi:hypothetical protein
MTTTAELVPFGTVILTLAREVRIGPAPSGERVIAEMSGFELAGERLNARLLGAAAADWIVVARDGTMLLDVRLALESQDGAAIYMQGNGRADAAQMHSGGAIYMAARFETGDARYAWLNRIVVVGKGLRDRDSIRYALWEVR